MVHDKRKITAAFLRESAHCFQFRNHNRTHLPSLSSFPKINRANTLPSIATSSHRL
jgi:hypothetical protein